MGHSPALRDALQHCAGNPAEALTRVGTRIGDYEITGGLGEGGTGVVYRGRHVGSNKPVAIKILRDACARKKDAVEQFLVEGRAARGIRHANVIDVAELGTAPDGTVFLAMECLEGESLRERLRQVQRLPRFEAINIIRQVAHGLGAAHEAGIVHGGLRPANIFLCTRKGRRRIVRRSKALGMRLAVEPEESFDLVKLLDFGMTMFLDQALGAHAPAGDLGAPHYVSPEQAEGRPADPRSDIYSLGAVFYEMVSGTVPFGGESLLDILKGHVSGVAISPSRRAPKAGIDARIDALILRCLKKNPSQRFSNTRELCEALDACTTECAFLRDAHRLPGITESGIDLSEALPQARRDPARSAEKPAVAPVADEIKAVSVAPKAPGTSVVAKAKVAPVAPRPTLAPVARTAAKAPPVDDPEVAVITPPPALVARAGDPAVAVIAPLPTAAPTANDATVAAITPRPVAADISDDSPGDDEPLHTRRPQVFALASVLLLGAAGIALWAGRGGSAARGGKTEVAPPTAAAPAPEPSPPSAAAVPVVAPAAAAASTAMAPAPATPKPEPAPPAEMASSTLRAPSKLALPHHRPLQARSARQRAHAMPVASGASPEPEHARMPAAEPATMPMPPAPPTVDDLVREAQQTWMRGHYAAAIGKAQAALDAKPNQAQAAQAYEVIGTCACAIGQVDVAREAASHLSDSKRAPVKAACEKRGVAIE